LGALAAFSACRQNRANTQSHGSALTVIGKNKDIADVNLVRKERSVTPQIAARALDHVAARLKLPDGRQLLSFRRYGQQQRAHGISLQTSDGHEIVELYDRLAQQGVQGFATNFAVDAEGWIIAAGVFELKWLLTENTMLSYIVETEKPNPRIRMDGYRNGTPSRPEAHFYARMERYIKVIRDAQAENRHRSSADNLGHPPLIRFSTDGVLDANFTRNIVFGRDGVAGRTSHVVVLGNGSVVASGPENFNFVDWGPKSYPKTLVLNPQGEISLPASLALELPHTGLSFRMSHLVSDGQGGAFFFRATQIGRLTATGQVDETFIRRANNKTREPGNANTDLPDSYSPAMSTGLDPHSLAQSNETLAIAFTSSWRECLIKDDCTGCIGGEVQRRNLYVRRHQRNGHLIDHQNLSSARCKPNDTITSLQIEPDNTLIMSGVLEIPHQASTDASCDAYRTWRVLADGKIVPEKSSLLSPTANLERKSTHSKSRDRHLR